MRSLLVTLSFLALCFGIGLIIFLESSDSYTPSNKTTPTEAIPKDTNSTFLKKEPLKKQTKVQPIEHLKEPPISKTTAPKVVQTPREIETLLNQLTDALKEVSDNQQPISQDNLFSHGNTSAPDPLFELRDLFQKEKYRDLISLHDDRNWAPHQEAALSYRAGAVVRLGEKFLKEGDFEEVIFLLEYQLNLSTDFASIYSILSEAYSQKGDIQKALNILEQGISLISNREQAGTLQKAQLDLVDRHLAFLTENEHWSELIKFVDSDPLPGSEKYYHYKLSTAQAYIKLYELEAAEEQLSLAAFNPDLDPEIQKLKREIAKIRAELLAMQAKEELNEDEIIVPIRVQNGAIYVKLLLNEQVEVTLLLDTGASITHLSKNTQKRLGSNGVVEDGHRIFITASGRLKAPVAYLELAQMETTGVTNLLVAFSDIFASDSGIDGLLGMNFLRFYNFSFDLDKEVLILKHKEK